MSLTTADKTEIRVMIREETEDLRTEVRRLSVVYEKIDGKYVALNDKYETMNYKLDNLITVVTGPNGLQDEVRRLGVLYEDMDGKIDTMLEMLSPTVSIRTEVAAHDDRLTNLEHDNHLLKETVADHSRQLRNIRPAKG